MIEKQPSKGKDFDKLQPFVVDTATFRPEITPAEELQTSAEPQYIPLLHGKATDAIAIYGRTSKRDPITGKLIIEANEVKAVIDRAQEEALAGGINVHKLLSASIGEFARLYHIGEDQPSTPPVYAVALPLKEYATKLGYRVNPILSDSMTDEEKSREKKRASGALKDARKKIKADLETLYSRKLTWTEKVKGKPEDYISISIIGTHGIRSGHIAMIFDPVFAQYLLRLPLTQYSEALLGIDARNPNAYYIGNKMMVHYFIDNNQRTGTYQQLKVKTLLKETDLPDIETVRKQRRSWEERIKEPLENALDTLYASGIVSEWYYCKSKGVRLTDQEATHFSSFEEWAETLIHFELRNAPDQTERLERKAEAVEQAKKKRRSYKRKPKE